MPMQDRQLFEPNIRSDETSGGVPETLRRQLALNQSLQLGRLAPEEKRRLEEIMREAQRAVSGSPIRRSLHQEDLGARITRPRIEQPLSPLLTPEEAARPLFGGPFGNMLTNIQMLSGQLSPEEKGRQEVAMREAQRAVSGSPIRRGGPR